MTKNWLEKWGIPIGMPHPPHITWCLIGQSITNCSDDRISVKLPLTNRININFLNLDKIWILKILSDVCLLIFPTCLEIHYTLSNIFVSVIHTAKFCNVMPIKKGTWLELALTFKITIPNHVQLCEVFILILEVLYNILYACA